MGRDGVRDNARDAGGKDGGVGRYMGGGNGTAGGGSSGGGGGGNKPRGHHRGRHSRRDRSSSSSSSSVSSDEKKERKRDKKVKRARKLLYEKDSQYRSWSDEHESKKDEDKLRKTGAEMAKALSSKFDDLIAATKVASASAPATLALSSAGEPVTPQRRAKKPKRALKDKEKKDEGKDKSKGKGKKEEEADDDESSEESGSSESEETPQPPTLGLIQQKWLEAELQHKIQIKAAQPISKIQNAIVSKMNDRSVTKAVAEFFENHLPKETVPKQRDARVERMLKFVKEQ